LIARTDGAKLAIDSLQRTAVTVEVRFPVVHVVLLADMLAERLVSRTSKEGPTRMVEHLPANT
jgi:hypothetical protein